jgi:hypothetical protein
MPAIFIVIADRGHLRMFSKDKEDVAGRCRFRAITDLHMKEVHQKADDKYTDQAGSFGNPGVGVDAKGSSERMGVGLEDEKRLLERIGRQITALLQEHGAERWMFAAPSEINATILSHVDPVWNERLVHNVPRDLVHVQMDGLEVHFGALPKAGTSTR